MEMLCGCNDILHIITNMLRLQNPKLVDHGSRVGYMVAKMLEFKGADQKTVSAGYMLGLLHDIGAYKKEDLEEVMKLETKDVHLHSIYGYLLVKSSQALDEYADAILFHHMPWNKMLEIDTPNKMLANLIFLADRVDVFIRKQGRPFVKEEMNMPGLFAKENLELFEKCEEQYEMQKRIMDGSYINDVTRYLYYIEVDQSKIKMFVRMAALFIDFRSEATVNHTITMVGASMALAKLANIPKEEMDNIYTGAYLHDLGKVAVDVAILEKPGKLTTDEMEIMKTHVVLSGEIIHGFVSEKVYRIATRHHEKLNGKGYPLGLSETDLTLEEQIVAVADIFSALAGKRSYKEEFPREKIIGIMSSMAQTGQISLPVVNLLIENYDVVTAQIQEDCKVVMERYQVIMEKCIAIQKQFAGFLSQA